MKKRLLIFFGIVLGVPLILILGAAVFIDTLVKMGVQKGGTVALKVPVTLKDASIKFSGKARFDGFEISNPPGFTEPRAVACDRIDASLKTGSLLQDVVEIHELTIVKPELTLEFAGARSNLTKLLEPLSEHNSKPAKETGPGKSFLIRKLRLEQPGARFRSDLIPGGTKAVTLPTIELENVGTAEGGATLGQILELTLRQLGDAALKAGQGLVPSELLHDLGGTLKEQKDKLEKGVKDIFQRP